MDELINNRIVQIKNALGDEKLAQPEVDELVNEALEIVASLKDAECRRIVEEIFKELDANFHGLYNTEIILKGFEFSQIWLTISQDIYQALKARTLKKLEAKGE